VIYQNAREIMRIIDNVPFSEDFGTKECRIAILPQRRRVFEKDWATPEGSPNGEKNEMQPCPADNMIQRHSQPSPAPSAFTRIITFLKTRTLSVLN